MRIAIVDTAPAAASTDALATELRRLGHDTVVEAHPGLVADEAPLLAHSLVDSWRASCPDVLLAVGWVAGLTAQVATREMPLPVVQRLHDQAGPDDERRARLEPATARGASMVLASCVSEIERLVAIGVPRTSVRVVPSGVDLTRFREDGPASPGSRAHRLVTHDNLGEGSRVADLVGALPTLPDCDLVVIGRSERPAAAGLDAARALTGMADRLGVGDRVRLPDRVEDDELPALLRSADLAVALRGDEDDVSFVLKAMACGVPVVAADVGPLADTVADEVTGRLLSAHATPEQVGDVVRALLTDAVLLESYGLAATDRARVRFSREVAAAATARVLEEACEGYLFAARAAS